MADQRLIINLGPITAICRQNLVTQDPFGGTHYTLGDWYLEDVNGIHTFVDMGIALALREIAIDRDRQQRWRTEAETVITRWETVFEHINPAPSDLGRPKPDIVIDELARLRDGIERLNKKVGEIGNSARAKPGADIATELRHAAKACDHGYPNGASDYFPDPTNCASCLRLNAAAAEIDQLRDKVKNTNDRYERALEQLDLSRDNTAYWRDRYARLLATTINPATDVDL